VVCAITLDPPPTSGLSQAWVILAGWARGAGQAAERVHLVPENLEGVAPGQEPS
jgi:hypothetical protein